MKVRQGGQKAEILQTKKVRMEVLWMSLESDILNAYSSWITLGKSQDFPGFQNSYL